MTKKTEKIEMALPDGMTENQVLAGVVLDPILRHAQISFHTGERMVQNVVEGVGTADALDVLSKDALAARKGDMRYASDTLFAQAHTLDTLMTEMMRKAWHNAGEYPLAFDRYMALGMKAQAQCRATLEALAKLHQPREQVVRHVHVHEGGQAVVAEEFHHHAGGGGSRNAETGHQSHAAVAALPGTNTLGQAVPVPSGKRKAAVPNARGHQSGRATRQSKRPEARAGDGGYETVAEDASGMGEAK